MIMRKLFTYAFAVAVINFAMTATVQAANLTLDDTVEGVMTFRHDANWEFGVTSQGTAFGSFIAGTTTTNSELGTFTGTYFVNSAGIPDPGSGIIYLVDSVDNNIISDIITASWSTSSNIATFNVSFQSSATGSNLGLLSVVNPAFAGLGVAETGSTLAIQGLFRDVTTAAAVSIPSNLTLQAGSVNDPIPEPATIILFGTGMVGLIAWRKYGKKNA
jgi:hypothetical protein